MKFLDIRSFYRGHEIKMNDSLVMDKNITLKEYNEIHDIKLRHENKAYTWIYCDTLEEKTDERPCKKCGLVFKFMTPDACIGELPGVVGACCGHGIDREKYIIFEGGNRIQGNGCDEFFKKLSDK